MTLFQDIYKNYGDLDATYHALQSGEILPKEEAIYNYTQDELVDIGGAKQQVIDEHNELLDSKPSSWIKGVMGSWRHNTFTGAAVNSMIDTFEVDKLHIDPEFNINKAVESVKQEFPSEAEQETLKKAKNPEHFKLLENNLRDYKEHKLNLERLGTPVALSAQLASEGLNAINFVPFLNISKAAGLLKTKDVLKGMAMQGTANAFEEKLIDNVYNDRTLSDYIASAAMGAGFAGVFMGGAKAWNTTKYEAGVRVKEEADAFAVNSINEKATEQLDEAQLGPKPERDYIDSSRFRDEAGELNPTIRKAMEKKGYDPDSEFDIWVQNYDSNGLIPKVKKVIQEKLNLAGAAQTIAGSDNPAFRALGRAFIEHGEGGTGVHKEHTAALEVEVETHRLFTNYNKSYLEHKALFAQEAESLGISMKEFDRMAYRYIDGEGAIGYDGKIRRPGDNKLNEILEDFRQVYNEHNKDLVNHIRAAGVDEAATFGESAHLFRRYDGEQFVKLTQELGGSKPIKSMIENSLRKGKGFENYSKRVLDEAEAKFKAERTEYQTKLKTLEGKRKEFEGQVKGAKDFTKKIQAEARLDKAIRKIEDLKKSEPKRPEIGEIDTNKVIKRVAEAVYNRMYKRGYEHNADANLLSTNNQTLLIQALEDLKSDGGLTKADIDHVKGILDTAGRDRRGDPTKGRLDMDMNTSIVVNGREVKMTDLLDVDLGAGYLSSGRYWIGRAALARKGNHFASEAGIEKSISRASELGTKQGMDPKEVKKQADILRKSVKLIQGQPIEDMSRWDRVAMRNIRKAVMNASLGKLGIVQASETGRMMAAIDSIQRLPAIKELMQGIATGKLDSAQLKEIQDFLVGNIGHRRLMNHPDFRADDFGHRVHPLEKFQDKMSYYLSMASGWNRVMVAQNQVLMSGLTQKWYRDVMNGTFKETQMRDLGVDDLLLKDLKDQMTRHATKEEGLDGNLSYTELGLENWDPVVRRKFAMMLTRKANNAIQMINVGETPMWLNTAMGKFLGQFRTFSIAALSKQTTRDYKMFREGDMEGAIAMQFNIATSVMANAAKIGFVAATLQGVAREEYLERALNPVGFANQVASYVGPFSAGMDLGNMVTDSVLGGGFAGGRYGITSAVPGLSYLNKLHSGVSGTVSAMLTDKEMSSADYRALVGTLPFSNNYAFEALNNAWVIPKVFDKE